MQPQSAQDYKQLLSEVIKKQIVILGPAITLSKARNVKGLTVSDDGTVTEFTGSPQEVTQALIDQFVQLSGLIVKKTMEPLLVNMPDGIQHVAPAPQVTPVAINPVPQAPIEMIPTPQVTSEPVQTAPASPAPIQTQPTPATQPITPVLETPAVTSTLPTQTQASPIPQPLPAVPTSPEQQATQMAPTAPAQPAGPAQPATNPLAA